MALNNKVTLIGYIGANAQTHVTKKGLMASFSLSTRDSYKDEEQNWQQKQTIWHQVLAFDPELVSLTKIFTKGTRVEVKGSLSYKSFSHRLENGKTIQKNEASVIARKIEPAPLTHAPENKA